MFGHQADHARLVRNVPQENPPKRFLFKSAPLKIHLYNVSNPTCSLNCHQFISAKVVLGCVPV